MSESMAFIGGVAVAGLAALLLLKGTNNSQIQSFVPPQIQQQPVVAPPAFPQQGQYALPPQSQPPVSSAINGNSQLRTDMERLKLQLNDLQKTNDQLKNQNQQLHTQLQNNYQQQINNALSTRNNQDSAQQAALATNQTNWWSSGIVWAVGGVIVTVGGGIVVAGISALFSQKQRPRTVQVIHPYNTSAAPIGPVRRAEFLPPRAESRRVESPEYEDMY
ncbi:MAG: heterocyst differentiation related protein [Mastigocoleus sp.]